jgi:hypothetical protein
MTVDVPAAESFLATQGRQLDRRRLELLLGKAGPEAVLAALDGYRNPDGGYGWGLEPDLRSVTSQPTAGMHAFEVIAEIGRAATPRAVELCDWMDGHTLADGGLPFALPYDDTAGCAPWWLNPDSETPNLQMTAQVAANAQRVARHDAAVANHPWLAKATRWCMNAIANLEGQPHAYELLFAIRFLDAYGEVDPDAVALLDKLGAFLGPDGTMPVGGGTRDEAMRPLDFAPRAGGPARRLFSDEVITAELDRLASEQQADGGWTVEFASASPASALEWRGYVTVAAVALLGGR